MAVAVYAQVEGAAELRATFGRMRRNVRLKIGRRVQKAGREILKYAVRESPPPRTVIRYTKPNFTGRLKASLDMKASEDGLTAEVGSYGAVNKRGRSYVYFVELGTGRRGASDSGLMVWKPPGYRYGAKPGMHAQPFLYHSWALEGKKFLRDCATILGEEIKGVKY